ncbi:hypothetical protein U2W12_13155 [Methylomicrobium sp. Wu6]|nr:hypothetical protein [Methylomicrobium sp. Wu6]
MAFVKPSEAPPAKWSNHTTPETQGRSTPPFTAMIPAPENSC